MVNVEIRYEIIAYNLGIQHDLICNCRLVDAGGTERYALPWWIIWNVPTGVAYRVALTVLGDVVAGTYTAVARAWANSSGGIKINDLDSLGAYYTEGVLTGMLDEATQTITISEGAVSARIDQFTITI